MKHGSAPASEVAKLPYASVRINAVRTAVLDSGGYVGPSIFHEGQANEQR